MRYVEPDKPVAFQLKFPRSLHQDLKKCAALDHRSMKDFILVATKERMQQFLVEDISSRDYEPIGLRRR